MKRIFLFIILLLFVYYSNAHQIDSLDIKLKKVWKLGKINIDQDNYISYLLAFTVENTSSESKILITDYLSKEGICHIKDCYLGEGYIYLKNISGLVKPKARLSIYKIIGVPSDYLHNGAIEINLIGMSYEEFNSKKYDYIIENEKRRAVMHYKKSKHLTENAYQRHVITIRKGIEKNQRTGLILSQKKKEMNNIFTFKLEL